MLPCCMNSTLLPDSFPQPHASLSFLLSAQHSPRFSPFVFNRFQTLSFSVSCNPFICHSYENSRVCTNNSHSGTQSSASVKIVVLSFHALTNCPLFPRVKQSLYFHALTNCPFRKSFLLTFMHRMGGVPPSQHSEIQTCRRSNRHTSPGSRNTDHGPRASRKTPLPPVTSHKSPVTLMPRRPRIMSAPNQGDASL